MSEQILDEYDVVVVGGGPAGLNGALMLGRSRRTVLVVDAGEPRNAVAEGIHGLLGHDGRPPAELRELGRREVASYGGHLLDGRVSRALRTAAGFTVELEDGRSVRARRLLLTTGLVDELPPVAGLRERWGRDVVHCPYCHGYEVRDQAIGVLGTGPVAVHQALLFGQLSDDVVLLQHTAPPLEEEQASLLAARGIKVVAGEVVGVEVTDDSISGLRLADGSLVAREVVAVASRMRAPSSLLAELGLSTVEHPTGMGQHLVADPTGATDVPGVWAAGNLTDLTAQVGASAAGGAMAGAAINGDLVMADARAR